MAEKLKKREEIDKKFKWAIEDMYASDEAWIEDYKKIEASYDDLTKYQGRLSESADVLLECLKESDRLSLIVEYLVVYSNQKLHEDTSNTKYQDYVGKASMVATKVNGAMAFIEPEILSMSDEKIREFMASDNGISEYRQLLSNTLRKKEHTLSKELEEVMASTADITAAADDVFSMFNNADVKFGNITDEDGNEVELTHGRYIGFLQSSDRRVRKEAFKAMYGAFAAYKNTLASIYNAQVKADIFNAKTRKYNSSIEYYLDKSNVDVTVYDNLVKTVHDNISLMHRYSSLRKKLLGVDELHMYDLYTPLVSDYEMKVEFEDAKEMVREGLKPLTKRYEDILVEGYNGGWIDVYENEGKRTGAYSWGAYGTHPYVLLNYNNKLDDVFTLAHEMGHAIHSYNSDANQTYVNAGYKIFVAEVASTCNEALLINDLLKKADDKRQKAYLLNDFLEKFRGTLYRQTMFAEFEQIAHKMAESGETLTADSLSKMYHELNELYFGKDVVIDSDIDMEWARIPHFYTPFYVYQYATGFSAAIAISTAILNGEEGAVDNYFRFLSSGGSDYPIELLKIAGVDMNTPKPIEDALKVFADLLDQFEEIMK